MSERSRIFDLLLILVGAFTALFGTILTELWLIPAKQNKLHQNELIENRLSKLYAPLIIATANGQFSMTGDLVFYRVYEVMEEYGYLADDEMMNKYLEFVGLCRFTGYDDLKEGSPISKPLPIDVIIEVVRQRKPPLEWTADSLEKAIKVEKEFIELLLMDYDKSRKTFYIVNQ